MSMFSERLQVLIDPEQRERLESVAEARGTSVATVVREAIDLAFPSADRHRQAAGRAVLAAEAMDVPDPEDLADELAELRGRRG